MNMDSFVSYCEIMSTDLSDEGENSRACIPSGPSRGAVICVRRESPDVSYTILDFSGTNTTSFCVSRGSSVCSDVGDFDGIVVIVTSAGSAIVVSRGGTEINIDFGEHLNFVQTS